MNAVSDPTTLGIQQTREATVATQDLIREAHQDVRRTPETVAPLPALLSLLERPEDQAEALGSQLAESLAMLATATSEIGMRMIQLEEVTTARTDLLSRISVQDAQILEVTDRLSRQMTALAVRLDQLHQDLFVDG